MSHNKDRVDALCNGITFNVKASKEAFEKISKSVEQTQKSMVEFASALHRTLDKNYTVKLKVAVIVWDMDELDCRMNSKLYTL